MSDHRELGLTKFSLQVPDLGERTFRMPHGGLLDLTESQVSDFQENVHAKFHYEPGLTGVTYVPLQRTSPINPIQVSELPLVASDALPHNRAIAKIGMVKSYWELVQNALLTGQYDFSNFTSFNMLPVYLGNNNEPLVVKKTIQKWNSLYGKSSYTDYIPMINYGGDADFTGIMSPNKNIPVYLPDYFDSPEHVF